jgi:hypothetical protein
MEDVLEVYHRPYDELYPQACLDEVPVQLVGETRVPQPLPGPARRQALVGQRPVVESRASRQHAARHNAADPPVPAGDDLPQPGEEPPVGLGVGVGRRLGQVREAVPGRVGGVRRQVPDQPQAEGAVPAPAGQAIQEAVLGKIHQVAHEPILHAVTPRRAGSTSLPATRCLSGHSSPG